MSAWSQVPLSEVIQVKHGFAFPGRDFSDDTSLPTLVTPGNFAIGGGFQQSKPKTFGGCIPSEYVLQPDDLLITMTDLSKQGDTLGLPALVPNDGRTYLHNQRIGLVQIIDPDAVNYRFLNYFLRTANYRAHVLGTASGSTVKHTSPSRILSYRAGLPPFAEQRSIAEVLGALDDKVAANQRSVATAVRLADSLFASVILGVGMSTYTFTDVADIGGGGTPSTKVESYWNGDIPWTTPTDVTALAGPYLQQTSRMIGSEGLAACSSPLYPVGSILMTSRATIGAFALAEVPTAVNQGFIVVNARMPALQMWLFHEMRSRVDEFIRLANGATFLELSRGRFKTVPVRLASMDVMREFGDRVKSIHWRAAHALEECRTLAALRDTLLPGLMSGKLRVRDAERSVEAVV